MKINKTTKCYLIYNILYNILYIIYNLPSDTSKDCVMEILFSNKSITVIFSHNMGEYT